MPSDRFRIQELERRLALLERAVMRRDRRDRAASLPSAPAAGGVVKAVRPTAQSGSIIREPAE